MHHRAGGSTHRQNDNSLAGRPRSAGLVFRSGIVLAAVAALAGCESFAIRAPGSASASSSFASRGTRENFVSPSTGSALPGTQPSADARLDVLVRPEIQLETLPPRPGDLLKRLRDSFSLTAANDAAFKRELEYFAAHPEYVERVVNRARPYLYFIADEIYRRGMPAELALLPIVESAFDPFAYSRGRAAGLWQIIPGTGRRLGVKQNWWFDGRRDLLDSTRAALDYLEELHDQFDGDWLLAIAGYNSGEGNVAEALREARKAGRSSDFWGIRPYLPKETRTYVPRLLAICSLIANPERYDLELPEVPDRPQLAVVDTGGQIDMALAAKLASLDVDDLYRLNAGVNRWATDPSGPNRLVVPIANAEALRAALASLGERERVEWTRYKVEAGDTLIELAGEYRTTPAVLREVNRLKGNTLRAGDYIMIPHALASFDSYSQSVPARLERTQESKHAGVRRVHVVRSGESLWSISRRYGVGVTALAQWNGMAPRDPLAVGRKLIVWTQPPPAEGAAAELVSLPGQSPAAELASVSEQDSTAELASLPEQGPAAEPASLPEQGPAAEPASLPGQDPAAQLASLEKPAQSAGAGDRIRRVNYVVRAGDSLYSIATRFRVSVAQILEWNDGLSADRYLQPGERVVMFVDVIEQST
ncbi:MAG TPA: LysM peptidoglycan-binding domain-containing protein [Gammaproteobacteria bacterium]|nr:LysM peptidoglycan-binding domain-containing protein [Gammaproteobacteria bacterium]